MSASETPLGTHQQTRQLGQVLQLMYFQGFFRLSNWILILRLVCRTGYMFVQEALPLEKKRLRLICNWPSFRRNYRYQFAMLLHTLWELELDTCVQTSFCRLAKLCPNSRTIISTQFVKCKHCRVFTRVHEMNPWSGDYCISCADKHLCSTCSRFRKAPEHHQCQCCYLTKRWCKPASWNLDSSWCALK